MMDQICPYTGLRSFSEDESLYFKGREEDIDQATLQLQKNKFLMLTGASGDGKSSLVYAGIIPNARSGFLKSKYTNWCVANFRPERTPFKNLAAALGKQLDISNSYTVQGELNHGFSALVDLYRNSKRYIDIHSSAWLQAGDQEQRAMKREAANLIILVDQFEEFFTNPENYHHGAPSKDANLVLNLLLETARIALDEDIPIYVVFTMRSDYIGQCAAFRGLPEYIGFSQFFVPRLNRSQLQQVIEEPAILNGNQISRRLTERLIQDLTEGVDQLPILQHALKQIWIAADHGNEELDLVHYAKVGGMPVLDLPEEQVASFNEWFSSLPGNIKACYHAPNLQNVVDTHSNKLYEQSAGYYKEKAGKTISDEDAKKIIRTTFTCLTKIDQGRAVRNRMTLQEITQILGEPDHDYKVVGTVLNIFREPDNTFINPFILEEDPESSRLHPDTVLDITHESLIRNWQFLGRWAKEEFDSHTVSLDFEKQLDRWTNSGRSDNFLLSIGPLTYFENWYNKAKPNSWWIARYLPEDTSAESRIGKANEILSNSRDFIKKSSNKHVITRTIMRYGPKRIGYLLLIIALLLMTSFAIKDHYQKQNSYVLSDLHQKSLALADNPEVEMYNKVLLLGEELKLGSTTPDEIMESVHDPVQKIRVMNALAANLIFQGRIEPEKEIRRSLFLTDSLFSVFPFPENNPQKISAVLNEMILFRTALEIAYFYHPDSLLYSWKKRNADRNAQWTLKILREQPAGFADMLPFNMAMENAINHHSYTEEDLKYITDLLSPFENGLKSPWLQSNYDKGKLMVRGAMDMGYGFNFNGLYQELAYLYAAAGNNQRTLQCMDTLLAYSQNNFQGDYATGGDNAANIAAVYFLYGKQDLVNEFILKYAAIKKIPAAEFYERMVGRMLHNYEAAGNLRLQPWMSHSQNMNLFFIRPEILKEVLTKYREIIVSASSGNDQRNFLLALTYKEEGLLMAILNYHKDNGKGYNDSSFDKSVSLYQSVSSGYLDEMIPIVDISGTESALMARKMYFIYPDIKMPFHPAQPRGYFHFYFADVFMDYILRHGLVNSFYPGPAELKSLNLWLNSYNTNTINSPGFLNNNIRDSVLKNMHLALLKNPNVKSIDLNWLYLYLGKYAQDSGRLDEMLSYYAKIEPAEIFNLLRDKDFGGFTRDQSFRMIAYAIEGYIKTGHTKEANTLVTMFKNPVNRSSLYAFAAINLLKEKFARNEVQPTIDSALKEMERVENVSSDQPNRSLLAYALTMQDPEKNLLQAYALIRNLRVKYSSMQDMCQAIAFHGDLYEAEKNIPESISATDQAAFLRKILAGYTEGNGGYGAAWSKYNSMYPVLIYQYIAYIDENN
jgi:energy-coupling factor transporter ATP-binding protein EcfA2